MSKKHKSKQEEEVAEEVLLPEDYKLLSGDRFVPYNADDERFSDVSTLLENYSTSLGDEPRETDEDGSPTPHVVDKTLWFDVRANQVKVFKGHDSNGRAQWEVAPFARKLVSCLEEGDSFGMLMGEIRNAKKDSELAYREKAEEQLQKLVPEPVSFEDLEE